MQPNPKKVTDNQNKSYFDMYNESFVRQNDPIELGNRASVRNISTGIQNNLNTQPMPTQGDFFTRAGTNPQVSNTGGFDTVDPGQPKVLTSAQEVLAGTDPSTVKSDALTASGYSIYTGYGDTADTTPTTTPTSFAELQSRARQDAEAQVRQEIADQIASIENSYAQQYNQYLDVLSKKYRVSDTSGLTGGLSRQMADRMSAAELAQLNQLNQQYNQALMPLRNVSDQDIKMMAAEREMQILGTELQTTEAKQQALAGLGEQVRAGAWSSLEEAQAYADSVGLGDISESILNRLQAAVNNKQMTVEDAKTLAAQYGIDEQGLEDYGFVDPNIISDDEEQQFLDEFYNDVTTEIEPTYVLPDTEEIVGGVAGVATAVGGAAIVFGATMAGTFSWTGVGLIVGGLIAGVGVVLSGMDISEDEITGMTENLNDTGITTDAQFFSGERKVDQVILSQRKAGEDVYNDEYRIDFEDGTSYTLTGADMMFLAVMIKEAGLEDSYQGILDKAEEIYNDVDWFFGRGTMRLFGSGNAALHTDKLYKSYFGK